VVSRHFLVGHNCGSRDQKIGWYLGHVRFAVVLAQHSVDEVLFCPHFHPSLATEILFGLQSQVHLQQFCRHSFEVYISLFVIVQRGFEILRKQSQLECASDCDSSFMFDLHFYEIQKVPQET